MRTQGENGEIFLGAKAGHNGESHNHNDVGNFIVYNGEEIRLTSDEGNTLSIKVFGTAFEFAREVVEYDDDSMRGKWGDKLYRVLLSAKVNKGEVRFEIR